MQNIIRITIFTFLFIISCGQKSTESLPKEIHWMTDIEAAKVLAKEEDKPIMVDFTATWCPPCNMMEDSTFNQQKVIQRAQHFINVRINVDKQKEVAEQYSANARKYGGIGIPNILFMDSGDFQFRHVIGYQSHEALSAVMDTVLTLYLVQKEKQ